MNTNTAFIQLGSNLGDRKSYLSEAVKLLLSNGLSIQTCGGIYETEPWGGIAQPAYLNQMLIVNTTESSQNLLRICLQAEEALGRTRDRKWDSRSIDIDIIYYNNWIVLSEELKIPHPYRLERNFIMKMMLDIAPMHIDPIARKPIKDLAENCKDILEVKLIS